MQKKIQDLWEEYEQHVLYILGTLSIAVISFVTGLFYTNAIAPNPITVYRPQSPPVVITNDENTASLKYTDMKDCIYVGSTKGSKYYPPSCSFAKKISKENLRCFSSDEDAQSKGYTKSKSCK